MRRRVHPSRDGLKCKSAGVEALAVLIHREIFSDVAMFIAGAFRALGRRPPVRVMRKCTAARHAFGVSPRRSRQYRVDLQRREPLVLPRLIRDFDDVLFNLRQVRHEGSHYLNTSR